MIGPKQRPLLVNTQHSQETNIGATTPASERPQTHVFRPRGHPSVVSPYIQTCTKWRDVIRKLYVILQICIGSCGRSTLNWVYIYDLNGLSAIHVTLFKAFLFWTNATAHDPERWIPLIHHSWTSSVRRKYFIPKWKSTDVKASPISIHCQKEMFVNFLIYK